MSLVTRCPACATTFKVVKDQLRISDGWVRCGRCSEVFDATLDLREAPDSLAEAVAPTPAPEPAMVVAEQPSREIDLASEFDVDSQPPASEQIEASDEEADFLDDEHDDAVNMGGAFPSTGIAATPIAPHDAESAPSTPPSGGIVSGEPWPDPDLLLLGDEGRVAVRPPAPPPLAFPDIDLSLPAGPPSTAVIAPAAAHPFDDAAEPDADAAATASNVQLQKALRRARAKAAKVARAQAREQKAAQLDTAPVVLAASEPESDASPVTTMPSFFNDAGANGFWQRAAVRRSMAALALLGIVVLVGQVAYQERDLIVARQPSLRPAIESMCRVLGCEIFAIRQINDIKVDGASFAREKSDEGYRFSFTLRNAADVPLAMPAVELSLLDTQERAVVRRVLMPAEFGAPAVLPARSERAASLSLRLTGPEAAAMPPVAGFRLETLYP